jgi:hypothetical protein
VAEAVSLDPFGMKIFFRTTRTLPPCMPAPCPPGMKYRQFDDVKLPVELPGSFPAVM